MECQIGISLEKECFKVAVLALKKPGSPHPIQVESLHTFPCMRESVKLFYNLPALQGERQAGITSGLGGEHCFIRKFHLPLKDKRKILSALPFQLESLIPFSEEKPIVCPLFYPLGKRMTSVTVIATLQSELTSHLEGLKQLDIAPDRTSCAQTALMRFARWAFPQERKVIILDVRDQNLCCVAIEGREIVLSQTVCIAERERISVELKQLATFLKQKGVLDDTTPWLLMRDEACAEIASQEFPGQRLTLPDPSMGAFAVAIGLALDALAADESSVQFCQREFTPAHIVQRRKKTVLSYLVFCGAATLAMGLGSWMMLSKKQKALTEELCSHLPTSIAGGELSTPEAIEGKLAEWQRSFKSSKNAFAFLPNVPKVSDLLAWISTHPALTTEEGGQKEGVEIHSVHYTLTKYPKIGEPNAPYTAQVQIDFSSTAPRPARDFHDALLKGGSIVNVKKDVKWQTQNQSYHTTFELEKGGIQ